MQNPPIITLTMSYGTSENALYFIEPKVRRCRDEIRTIKNRYFINIIIIFYFGAGGGGAKIYRRLLETSNYGHVLFMQRNVSVFYYFKEFFYEIRFSFFCSDNDGAYYWHIKSGIIQRDPPRLICEETNESLKNIDKVPKRLFFDFFCWISHRVPK